MIYNLNNNKIKLEMTKFMKTTYGKITFILSYSFFLILLLTSIVFLIYSFKYLMFLENVYIYLIILIDDLLILLSFILGTKHYYNELKLFIEKRH